MITIIVDNYEGQKFTYTMPDTATVDIVSENFFLADGELFKTGLAIEVNCADGIKVEREDLPD